MTVLYFLATIVLLVVIHEWGHFAAARFFGVGVRSFTVGFGKQFVSWVDPKTGTSWGIAPYPLGGYVGLLGEKEAGESEQTPVVTGTSFTAAPLHAKLAILFAGPLVNLVFAALLYGVLAYSAPPQPLPILATPPEGSAAALAGFKSGDVITSINGSAVKNWRDVQTALAGKDSDDTVTVESATPSGVKKLIMSGLKAQQNYEDALGLRLYTNGLLAQKVLPGSAAEKAGLKLDDIMLQIDKQAIDHPAVLLAALQSYTAGAAPLAVEVKRGNQTAVAYLTPELDAAKTYRIGVQFAGVPRLSEQTPSVFEAMMDGLSTASLASVLTVKAFGTFLLKPFASDQLAGPITIAQTAKASADRGWMAALAFVAGLSISVGILNLLPVPLLDGGQMLYHFFRATIQALVLRAKLPFKIVSAKHVDRVWSGIGICFVLALTVLAMFTDIRRLLSAF